MVRKVFKRAELFFMQRLSEFSRAAETTAERERSEKEERA